MILFNTIEKFEIRKKILISKALMTKTYLNSKYQADLLFESFEFWSLVFI